MCTISVVMPCFNAAATVGRAVRSIQQQTFTDWRLIVVDDGSTDDSADIVESMAAKDTRIHLIRSPHLGVVGASQRGLDAVHSEFIARMDADDVSLPDRLAIQLEALQFDQTLDAISCLVRFAGDPNTAGGYAHHVEWTNQLNTVESIALKRFIDLPVPHPTLMYRRKLIERCGGYREGDFPEDYEMVLRWIAGGARIGKVNRVLYDWHDPPTRLSRNDPRYAMQVFHQCKAPYLTQAIAASGAGNRELWIWGAGRPARKCARPLFAAWRQPAGYIDIDPVKIGRTLHGAPVVSPESLPPKGSAVIVAYVGTRGAGENIRQDLVTQGWVEGIDFWIAA